MAKKAIIIGISISISIAALIYFGLKYFYSSKEEIVNTSEKVAMSINQSGGLL